jgi:hypothetical protein
MSAVYTVYRIEPISTETDCRPYIGVTCNFKRRIYRHREDYRHFPNRPVYEAIRSNGGFENYCFKIIQEFNEYDYEDGVAMRLSADLEATLIRQHVPLKGCINREIPGRSKCEYTRAWRANKRATDPDGYRTAHRCAVAAYRAKKMSADPDGYRAARRCALAAWRAKNKAAKLAAASD